MFRGVVHDEAGMVGEPGLGLLRDVARRRCPTRGARSSSSGVAASMLGQEGDEVVGVVAARRRWRGPRRCARSTPPSDRPCRDGGTRTLGVQPVPVGSVWSDAAATGPGSLSSHRRSTPGRCRRDGAGTDRTRPRLAGRSQGRPDGSTNPDQMRLEIQIGQDPPDLRGRDPDLVQCLSDQPVRPLRLHLRSTSGHRFHDLQPLVVTIGAGPTRRGRSSNPAAFCSNRRRHTPDVLLLIPTARRSAGWGHPRRPRTRAGQRFTMRWA